MTSYASKAYYFSKKNTLKKYLEEILTDEPAMSVICDFLNEPYSCCAEIRYNSSIGFFDYFLANFDSTKYPENSILRIVATLPDGTVWYDSSKVNTYTKFLSKTINENHNSRPAFLQALSSEEDCGCGFETKPSSTLHKNYQVRSVYRLGSCQDNAIGCIGLSLTFDVVNNVTGPASGNVTPPPCDC